MVEHICKWGQDVSFYSVYKKSENSAADDGPCPAKISELILSKLRAGGADLIVVLFEIINLLMYLNEERGANQFHKFIVTIVDGKGAVILWENI